MLGRMTSCLTCKSLAFNFMHGLCPQRGFSSSIFISRLSSYTTEESLEHMFTPFGTIKEVRLVRDKVTNRPKGFGFVKYENEDEANRALKAMNYKIIGGRLLFVEIAKDLQEK